MKDEWITIGMIAEACHEVNRVLQRGLGEEVSPPWTSISRSTKDSAIDGVFTVLNNPYVSCSDLHQSWMNFKSEAGWVYGEVKDEAARTHPNLIPWEDLPEEQKAKDEMFRTVVLGFFSLEGYGGLEEVPLEENDG